MGKIKANKPRTKMKQVTLHIPDNKYPLFLELAHSLSFVKKIEVDEKKSSKGTVLKGIKNAVKEMNMVKAGKLKSRDARALINEL
jgi:hypothetical protein